MKTVLFVLGSYQPYPSANGLCCERIIKQMLRQGDRVLTLSAEHPGVPNDKPSESEDIRYQTQMFYRCRAKAAAAHGKPAKLFWNALTFFANWQRFLSASLCYPFSSRTVPKRIHRNIEKIYKHNKLDMIVGVSFPADTALAVCSFKKKHTEVFCVSYFLDPFVDGRKHKFYSRKQSEQKALRAERYVVENSDLLIAQKEHRSHYAQHYPDLPDTKIQFLGVPMLEYHPCAQPENARPQAIFAGSLWPDVRNPKFIIEVMKLLPETDFHIYTPASETWLSEFIEGAENVLIHGRVSHEEIKRIFENADLLINIGNSLENSSPSKLMEYMGYCKPIVSTYRLEHDSCITIMEKYPLGIALDERMEPAAAAGAVRELMKAPKNVEFAKIKELFREQTPEAFIELTEQARMDRQ